MFSTRSCSHLRFARWMKLVNPASQNVHRTTTGRQFHSWRGPCQSASRSSGGATQTRSALRTTWNSFEKISCTVGPSCRQASYTTIAQSLALLNNTLSRVAGVKTRSKQLPAILVTANAMLKIGGKLSWANHVKCTGRRVSSSRPRRL